MYREIIDKNKKYQAWIAENFGRKATFPLRILTSPHIVCVMNYVAINSPLNAVTEEYHDYRWNRATHARESVRNRFEIDRRPKNSYGFFQTGVQ